MGPFNKRSNCPHVASAAFTGINNALVTSDCDTKRCDVCLHPGPNLWLCLHENCCSKVLCGESKSDHSSTHNNDNPEHCLHVNLTTSRVWCYSCHCEVFILANEPPVPLLLETAYLALSKSANKPGFPLLKNPPDYNDSADESALEDETIRLVKPRGLMGLQNLGNTCFMNSALQALSNLPPLNQFFLDCPGSIPDPVDKKPGLAKAYGSLVREIWGAPKSPAYMVPNGVLFAIKMVFPMFRGFQQHDSQEFLRCFMDQLHEELKTPVFAKTAEDSPNNSGHIEPMEIEADSDSRSEEEDYETCDSGVSENDSLSEDEGVSTHKMKRFENPGEEAEPFRDAVSDISDISSRRTPSPPVVKRAKAMAFLKRKSPSEYKSVVSDVFDGRILSSVQCLTCNRVSSRVETFQDLSLPIPSKDQLSVLHKSPGKHSMAFQQAQGWLSWMWGWVWTWVWGPPISLHDCLAAFFSADELKGDNMYSCEKCKKLRNGVKFASLVALPEVLTIHLKRFRHEPLFSTKLSTHVAFPLEGLNAESYVNKDCISRVTTYDLMSVIVHQGTASGGHYTCYARNVVNDRWYEFDDTYVTEVSPETVSAAQAYVLFYKKSSVKLDGFRREMVSLLERYLDASQEHLMPFYVSRQWINRFNTFAEPGPIDNTDFLCPHGAAHPDVMPRVMELCTLLAEPIWKALYDKFGGGPPCNQVYECVTCRMEKDFLDKRREEERATFIKLNDQFRKESANSVIYALAMSWFRQWEEFVKGKKADPPGPIENSSIIVTRNEITCLRAGSDYAHLSPALWSWFLGLYGGGPEVLIRQ